MFFSYLWIGPIVYDVTNMENDLKSIHKKTSKIFQGKKFWDLNSKQDGRIGWEDLSQNMKTEEKQSN